MVSILLSVAPVFTMRRYFQMEPPVFLMVSFITGALLLCVFFMLRARAYLRKGDPNDLIRRKIALLLTSLAISAVLAIAFQVFKFVFMKSA